MEGEVTVPTAAKRCRCCMTPGIAFKDLSLEYEWMGEKEVYADMLLESFDVTLERNTKAGWTICDACISRLRDSSNFKKQVLYSERCLLQGLFPSDEKTLSIVYKPKEPAEMKLESQSEGDDAEEFETHYLDEDLDLDEDVKEIKQEPIASTSEMSNDEDTPLSSLRPMKVKSKVAAKVKSKTIGKKAIKITVPPEKLTVKKLIQRQKLTTKPQLKPKPNVKILESSSSHKLIKLSTKPVSVIKKGPAFESLMEPAEYVINEVTVKKVQPKVTTGIAGAGGLMAKMKMKEKYNALVLVESSNVTPFRWVWTNHYMCYYCSCIFDDAQSLLSHSRTSHDKSEFRGRFVTHQSKGTLNVDATDLRCSLCDHPFKMLEQLQDHLIEEHEMNIEGPMYKIATFDLMSTMCTKCDEQFTNVTELSVHSRGHYRSFECSDCGQGFHTQKQLLSHGKKHSGETTCHFCNKVFESMSYYDLHVKSVHLENKYLCHMCDKSFPYSRSRQEHLMNVHGLDVMHKCPECDDKFLMKVHMTGHYKRMHLKIKNALCYLCGAAYYNSYEVNKHIQMSHGLDG